MTMICGLPLDLERPTAAAMLAPTLACGDACWRCAAYEGALAVLVLGPDVADDEMRVACRLHTALSRGLLVVL